MKTNPMNLVWRGLGHGGVLICSLLALGTIAGGMQPQHALGSANFEWCHGYSGSMMLAVSALVNYIILTTCCYLAATNRRFWPLLVPYITIAIVVCMVRDRALIGFRNEKFAVLADFAKPEVQRAFSADSPFPSVPRIPIAHSQPSILELLEVAWFFAIPLAAFVLLWAKTVRARRRSHFPFSDPANTVCLTVQQVMNGDSPILLVTHDAEDGMWQFLTGGEFSTKDALLVALSEVFDRDCTIGPLADLPLGGEATRTSRRDRWQRREVDGARAAAMQAPGVANTDG